MSNVALGRYLCKVFVRRKFPVNHSWGTSATNMRFKSEDQKQSSDIVIEKEKTERKFELPATHWDGLPVRVAKVKGYVKELFKHPAEQRLLGRFARDNEILYYFRDESDLNNWVVGTDSVIGGKSWAEFVLGENGVTATFRGFLSQRLPRFMLPSSYDKLEDKPYFRGFACIETKPFMNAFGQEDRQSIATFNAVEVRIRGEGRKYLFEMLYDDGIADLMYYIPISTRGGQEWETVKLPYGKFIASKRNTNIYCQRGFMPNFIKTFRFLLLDGIEGPFQLDIDYIALIKDRTQAITISRTDHWDPNAFRNASIGTW